MARFSQQPRPKSSEESKQSELSIHLKGEYSTLTCGQDVALKVWETKEHEMDAVSFAGWQAVALGRQCRPCANRPGPDGHAATRSRYPEGISANSRWSSVATPPERRLPSQSIPKGLQPFESLAQSHRLESLRDTRATQGTQTGGFRCARPPAIG